MRTSTRTLSTLSRRDWIGYNNNSCNNNTQTNTHMHTHTQTLSLHCNNQLTRHLAKQAINLAQNGINTHKANEDSLFDCKESKNPVSHVLYLINTF
jgi:hypothetical protein